ncbi:hypothetical protein [Achromobacter xylosoxidans]|uniref:PD-(D/E)XK nuclease domain-containing protein n=1 Tax=Alcaligenes xylosoxydans xylosoxydans TaxID=85698 RepID=UPI000F4F7F37|nr:hypothetical protein [Achromobacter xylosoxidans]
MREEGLLLRCAQAQIEQAAQALSDLENAEFSSTLDQTDEADHAQENLVYHLKRALLSIGTLADRMGARIVAEKASKLLHDDKVLRHTERIEDLHSAALAQAYRLLEPLGAMLGLGIVTGQDALANVLRSTRTILDGGGVTVKREEDVRNGVLSVIRYVFDDATKELTIPRIIKSSKADIAIPSIQTLIEFKLIRKKADLVASLDGVSADMRNYCHPEWRSIYGVFYMQDPFFTQEQIEREWKMSLSDKTWTPIIVLGPIAKAAGKAKKKPASGSSSES